MLSRCILHLLVAESLRVTVASSIVYRRLDGV